MVCTAHRLQCKTPHFPKHKFPIHATRTVQTQLKSTILPKERSGQPMHKMAGLKASFILETSLYKLLTTFISVSLDWLEVFSVTMMNLTLVLVA